MIPNEYYPNTQGHPLFDFAIYKDTMTKYPICLIEYNGK